MGALLETFATGCLLLPGHFLCCSVVLTKVFLGFFFSDNAKPLLFAIWVADFISVKNCIIGFEQESKPKCT